MQVGDDKTIKQWKMESPVNGEDEEPLNTVLGKVSFTLSRFYYRADISICLMRECNFCRQSSQDWTITDNKVCLQHVASRWTSGMSRGAVLSALLPGGWTALAQFGLTLWRY